MFVRHMRRANARRGRTAAQRGAAKGLSEGSERLKFWLYSDFESVEAEDRQPEDQNAPLREAFDQSHKVTPFLASLAPCSAPSRALPCSAALRPFG